MILRRVVRDLRALGSRAVLVVLAIAMAAGTGSGASLTFANVHGALDSFYSEYHLADVEVSTWMLRPDSELLARAEQAGATHATTRLVVPGKIEAGGSSSSALFVGMPSSPPLNQLQLLEGKGLGQLEERGVVIEVDFARTHGLSLGSRVELEVPGYSTPAKVEGIGRTPESLLATADPEYFVLQRGSLAYVYAPLKEVQERVAEFAGSGDGVNVLLADFPPDRELAGEQILTQGEAVSQVVPRSQLLGYRATQLNMSALSSFTPVLTAVLASVAILLIAVTMMRLVQTQRRELGTMLALGHKRSTVIFTALLPALALGVLAGLLAIPIGVGVAKLMATEFSSSYGFLSVPTRLTFSAAALALALALGTSLLAAVFPAVTLSRLTPAEALRGDAPTSHRIPGWARVATGGAGTAWAYGLRNVLRTPLRSGLSVLSLGGAIGLGIAVYIVATSVREASETWFSEQPWTQTVVLQQPTGEVDALRVATGAGAERVEPIASGSVDLERGSKRLGVVNAVGVPRASRLQSIGLPLGGIKPGTTYVSKQIANEFDLEVGERVTLAAPLGQLSVVIAGTANTLAEGSSYLPLNTVQDLLGLDGKVTTLLVKGGAETEATLRESPRVAKVVSKAGVKSGLDDLIAQLSLLINTLVAISLAVGALFLISSLAMSALERQAEFAVLRALGWGMRALAVVVVVESVVLSAGGAVVGSLIAPMIASPLIESVSSAWFHVDYDLRAKNYLIVIVPALVLAVLVALQISARIARLNVARAAGTRVAG